LLECMDLQTLLDLPEELKGEEWGPNGKPPVPEKVMNGST
jgi:hypothetical protein